MKIVVILLFLFASANASAQSTDTKDTTYVVDRKLSDRKLGGTSPYDILNIQILLGKDVDGHPNPPTVIVLTRKFAISEYQKKLGSFSNDYKKYLDNHNNRDDSLLYVLNGVVLEGKQDEVIGKLFAAVDKMKTVDFMDKYFKNIFNNNRPIIIITTKK